jgi:predicted RND superfamily exporter protein
MSHDDDDDDPSGPLRNPNLYARIAAWTLGHRKTTWAALLLSTVITALLGLPPKIDSNLLNLLPDTDPVVKALRDINAREGGLNVLSLSFRADDPARLDPFLDELQARFEKLDTVEFAVHELDPDLAKQVALMQLEPEELGELNGRLKGALVLGIAAQNPIVAQRLMDMGPLTEKIAKAGDNALFRSAAEGRGRLVVRPKKTSADPDFARQFMEQTRSVLATMHDDGKDEGVELLWMGGAYRHNVEDVEGIRRDLMVTGVASTVLSLLIAMLGFRTLKSLAMLLPPLVVANFAVFAFAKLFVGPLNTYTSFSSAILFGLGIDFGIHLAGRFREYRAAGLDVEPAIVRAWHKVGPPCATAALTAAAGFVALTTARFVGFVQLGVLLAFGLLACLACMVVFLPVLVATFDAKSRVPLLGSLTEHAPSSASYRFSMPGVGLMAVATVAIAVWAIPRVDYEYDVSALRRDGYAYSELSEQEQKLARESYSPIVVFYDEAPNELEADQAKVGRLIHDGALPHVATAVSIANVLPHDQEERLAKIRELVAMLDDPDLRYLPPPLVKRLLPLRGLQVRTLTRADLPPAVTMLLGGGDASSPRMLLLPKGNMWDVREAQKLREEVDRGLPGRLATGEYLGVASMFLMAFGDAPRIAGIALLLVSLLAWWDLRKPLWTIGVIGTLLAGVVWAAGAIEVFGVKLSMVNIAGIPILFGIAVDVIIHLLHRLEEEGPGGVRRALRTTGVASALSTLTNMASFFALTFADSRSIRGLGWLVVIGLVVEFVVGMALLPLIWSAQWKLRGLAPADQPMDEEELTGG